MCVALHILATTPLGHCCKQEYALSQVAWLNKDEREKTPARRSTKVLLFSGLVYCAGDIYTMLHINNDNAGSI